MKMNTYIIDGKNVKIEKKFPTFNIHIDGELYQVASEYEIDGIGSKKKYGQTIYLSPVKAEMDILNIIKEAIERYLKDIDPENCDCVFE